MKRKPSALQERHDALCQKLELAQKREGQLLRAITDNLSIVIGRLDGSGYVVEACGERLLNQGMTAKKIRNKCLVGLFPAVKETVDRALKGEYCHCELWDRSPNHDRCVEFYAFPDASRAASVVFFIRDISHRKKLERGLLDISDNEQQRIGADLHDGLGQHLTGVACLAAALNRKLETSGSPFADEARSIASHVNAAIDMTRGFARGLCPVQIEKEGSLHSALEDFAYQVQRLHGVKCRLYSNGSISHLDRQTALHLYRIAQEAVNNALRHSAADLISITLNPESLVVEDNGCGFEPATSVENRRLGLRLMEYRASLIGGSFKISRRPSGGMRVECLFSAPQQ